MTQRHEPEEFSPSFVSSLLDCLDWLWFKALNHNQSRQSKRLETKDGENSSGSCL